jgi:hypothetical protein
MFVRFREKGSRLQVSLIETHRDGGKVQHEHIASLGSIEIPQTIEARIAFWQRLHPRLAKLSNRVTDQAKLLGEIHARIPMVTLDEMHAEKLANAETIERFWAALQDMNQAQVEDQKALIARAERAIASAQAAANNTAANAARAKGSSRAPQERRGRARARQAAHTPGHGADHA